LAAFTSRLKADPVAIVVWLLREQNRLHLIALVLRDLADDQARARV
jgi:hypothetical protein